MTDAWVVLVHPPRCPGLLASSIRCIGAARAVLCAAVVACGARTNLDVNGAHSGTNAGDAGGSAATTAPRPLAPLSTSRVTSRRPTLRWALPAGVADATVELCLDRACTQPLGAPAHVVGTSYAPASDLPAGVVYWRVRPSTESGVTSPTWQMIVGARTAPVDTSWGTTLDVNGDGYADLAVAAISAVGAPGEGGVTVYLGGADGLTAAATSLTVADDGSDVSVASAGDVNGDGFADLVVGAETAGTAYVYLGSGAGLASTPATTLTGPDSGGFGLSVASAGDVNGDGYADVVVGALGALSNDAGRAYIYLGSAAGLATSPATTLTGPGGAKGYFGGSVASAGDVNGDGFADVAVGAYGASNTAGNVYVYIGSAGGLANAPATTLTGPGGPNDDLGISVAGAGDVNGDGYADLIVGAFEALMCTCGGLNGPGSAYVYLGGPNGLATAPAVTLGPPDGKTDDLYGGAVASAGDVNGDGYADVVVGGIGVDLSAGQAFVYLGSATGLAGAPATTLAGAYGQNENFAQSVGSAGDENGDGYADVVVGSNGQSGGRAYVFRGGATGVTGTPAATLVGADGAQHFGISVFGASD